MDALRQTVAGGGCSADGAAAAQNPVGALVNGLLDAPQAPDHKQFSGVGGGQAAVPAHVVHGAAAGRVQEQAHIGSHAAAAAHAAAVAEANSAMQYHAGPMGPQSSPVHAGSAVTAYDPAAAHAHAARAHDLERAHREAAFGAAWHQASAHSRPGAAASQPAAAHHPAAYAGAMPQLQHQMPHMQHHAMHHAMQYPMQYQMPQPMQQARSFAPQHQHSFQHQQQASPAPAATADSTAATADAAGAAGESVAANGGAQTAGDAAMRSAAARLREAMESSDDPRFQESALLDAMRTLSGGEAAPEQSAEAADGVVRGEHPALEAARQLRAEQEAARGAAVAEGVSPAEMEARMAEAGYSGGDGSVDFEALWRDLMTEENTEALEHMWREGYKQRLAQGMDAAVDAAGPAGAAEGVERIPYALGAREENHFLSDATHAANAEASGAAEAVEGESGLFARAVALLRSGRTTEAVHAFEAELHEREDNAEAWRLLGQCHAELDADRSAIACLQRAVEHDPYNLDALLALGVSHVNELQHHAALETLRAWVEHNPRFQGLQVEDDPHSDGSLLDGVTQLMLRAAAWAPQDAQVQEVLGVLYNVSHDYGSAAAAFDRALAASAADPALWNKLGATHANGNRSEEAVPAYRR